MVNGANGEQRVGSGAAGAVYRAIGDAALLGTGEAIRTNEGRLATSGGLAGEGTTFR